MTVKMITKAQKGNPGNLSRALKKFQILPEIIEKKRRVHSGHLFAVFVAYMTKIFTFLVVRSGSPTIYG